MSEPIKPALAPEEWASPLSDQIDGYIDWEVGIVDVSLGRYSGRSVEQDRHALAAVTLYGQPFGFTRADVSRLRQFAGTLSKIEWGAEHAEGLNSLADRIESLLPPESVPPAEISTDGTRSDGRAVRKSAADRR